MQNDLVVFEFFNDNGQPVLLRSSVPGQLAEICAALVGHKGSDFGDAQPEFWLAQLDPGSLKVGFRQFLNKQSVKSWQEKADLTNSMLDLLMKSWRLVFSVGIGINLLVASNHVADAFEKIAENERPDIERDLIRLVRLVSSSGADRCVMRVPDQPEVEIAGEWIRRADRLGSQATPAKRRSVLDGQLTELSAPVRGVFDGPDVLFQSAKMTSQGEESIVIIVWRAKGPRPEPGDKIEVQGELMPIPRETMRIYDDPPDDFLRAVGLLVVERSRSLSWK